MNVSAAPQNGADYPFGVSPFHPSMGFGTAPGFNTDFTGYAYPAGYRAATQTNKPNGFAPPMRDWSHPPPTSTTPGFGNSRPYYPNSGTANGNPFDQSTSAYDQSNTGSGTPAPSGSIGMSTTLMCGLLILFMLIFFVLVSIMRTSHAEKQEVITRLYDCPTHHEVTNMIYQTLMQHNVIRPQEMSNPQPPPTPYGASNSPQSPSPYPPQSAQSAVPMHQQYVSTTYAASSYAPQSYGTHPPPSHPSFAGSSYPSHK
jgi:hypothetical protein